MASAVPRHNPVDGSRSRRSDRTRYKPNRWVNKNFGVTDGARLRNKTTVGVVADEDEDDDGEGEGDIALDGDGTGENGSVRGTEASVAEPLFAAFAARAVSVG